MKRSVFALFGACLVAASALQAQVYSFSTLAGQPGAAGNTNASGAAARFNRPTAVAVDSAGNIYVADLANPVIRKVTPAGVVTTFASLPGGADALAVDATGNVFAVDHVAHVVRRVTPAGVISIVAGQVGAFGIADGTGVAARFNTPRGIALHSSGALYVADTSNHTVRRISAAGAVTTLAGLAGVSGSVDGPGPLARFNSPIGITVDAAGIVYVIDSSRALRRIALDGAVSTLAGSPSSYGGRDGTGSAASFGDVRGLANDSAGMIYAADGSYHTIRRITPLGEVTTVAGLASVTGIDDGFGANVRFSAPEALAVDAAGNLYLADTNNHTLRKGTAIALPAIVTQPVDRNVNNNQGTTFTVAASGGAPLAYRWERQPALGGAFVPLENNTTFSGVAGDVLTLSAATTQMSGDRFRCVVTNEVGTAVSGAAVLTVLSAPAFTSAANATFYAGREGQFFVKASGVPAPTFSITSGALPAGVAFDPVAGLISGTPASTAGSPHGFTVTATNGSGNVSQVFTLTVQSPPVLPTVTAISGPRQIVIAGQSLLLAVTTSGSSVTYQWKRNGRPVVGATSDSFAITNAAMRDAGYYQVVLSNAAGSTLSPTVFVNVLQAAPQVVAWGSNASSQTGVPSGLTGVVAVAAGSSHSLALKSDGTVAAWGYNAYGQTTVPAGLNNVVAIDGGGNFSMALKADGTVAVWGESSFTTVPAAATGVVAIAASSNHCLALKADGTLIGWGYGWTAPPSTLAVNNIVSIAAAGYTSIGVRADGTVVTWSSGYGAVPSTMAGVVTVAAGSHYAMALKEDGTVALWSTSYNIPTSLPALTGVTVLSLREHYGLALLSNRTISSWGDSAFVASMPAGLGGAVAIAAGYGHGLMLRDSSADRAPTVDTSPVSVAANQGQSVTFAVGASAGTAGINYQWMRNGTPIAGATRSSYTVSDAQAFAAGQYQVTVSNSLGSANSGVATLSINGAPVVSATSGGRYVVASGGGLSMSLSPSISTAATVQWQRNGRLLEGATTRTYSFSGATHAHAGYYQAVFDEGSGPVLGAPVWVTIAPTRTQVVAWGYAGNETNVPAGLIDVTALSARLNETLALRADGTVVRWGNYSHSGSLPVLANIVALAAGYNQSLALQADGNVVEWPTGGYSSTPSTIPAEATGLVGIASGINHALGLKADGSVIAWGSPTYGATAVPAGLKNVVALAAGDRFSLALRVDGTVVGWGRNSNGESAVPSGLSGVVAIAAGSNHSVALKSDGTVVGWGSSWSGQLTVPVGLAGVVSIAAGESHVVAQKSDGSVVAWGNNYYNQTQPPAGLTGVFAVAGGSSFSVAVRNASGDTVPAISAPPASLAALTGQNVTLAVTAGAGTAPLGYQWRKAGASIPGATAASLTLGAVTPASAGGYDVVVSNYLGSATSAVATVTVSATSAVNTAPAGRHLLNAGQSLTLTGTSALSGTVSFQWLRNGRPIPGATNASYAIVNATWTASGAYRLVATNSVGPATSFPVYVAVATGLQIRAWGDNYHGQVSVPSGLAHPIGAAAGARHSLALNADGTVTGWGSNSIGQASSPPGLSNVVAIAAGNDFSMALGANGTVTTWGSINYTPAEVGEALAISAGPSGDTALALRLDGSVVAWSAYGVQASILANLTNVIAIAAGGSYHAALKADGTVVTWSSSLVTPAALKNVIAIAGGQNHLLALKADGTVVTWGSDSYHGSPAVPANLNGVVAIAAGSGTSFAIKADRSVVTWGTSYYELLGGANAHAPISALSIASSHGLALRDPSGDAAPVISTQPAAVVATTGQNIVLSVSAAAVPPPSYQWYRNGLAFSGATSSSLALNSISTFSAGVYSVTVSNALGSVSSHEITVTVNPSLNQRALLAATSRAETGAGILGTFTIEGTLPKTMLIRGVGPALATFGVADLLSDPQLTITTASGSVLVTNDDWHSASNSGQVISASAAAGAFALTAGGKDAAILRSFSPGTYQVRLTGAAGAGGAALLEIFDTDSNPRLVYAGTHAVAGGGARVLVQGFALAGVTPGRSYLVRALGPALGSAGALADPELRIFNSANIQVAANDNWSGDSALVALAANVGAMPLAAGSKDAALDFIPAAGGAYTVQVSGVGGASGHAFVEIFEADAQRAADIPAAIVVPPVGVTVLADAPAQLGVVAVGKPAPTFQWRRNGTPIVGATGARLAFSGVQNSDTGDYSVVATNAAGTATSPGAAVALVTQAATHRVVGPGYYAGSTVTITNTLAYTGTASSLGWSVTLPAGWSYASGGGAEGDTRPAVGSEGTVAWAWNSPPASPFTFTYTLNVPAGQNATATLAATAVVRTGGDPQTSPVSPGTLLVPLAPPLHSADTRGATPGSAPDGRIELFELTRIIELYNTRHGTVRTGAYRVDAAGLSEDGFLSDPDRLPGTPAALARFHSADTGQRDGAIGLVELTRVIELYNTRSGTTRTGQYRMLAGTEDGFAPGP